MPTTTLTVGQTVTIEPRVTFSADRDTEPGAQPWTATCVGWTPTKILVMEPGYDTIRQVDRELVREAR